jgi:hypothetical protein
VLAGPRLLPCLGTSARFCACRGLCRWSAAAAAQADGRAFETPEALLSAAGLHAPTQRSFRAELKARARPCSRPEQQVSRGKVGVGLG